MSRVTVCAAVVGVWVTAGAATSGALALPSSDFDDGTFQGWTTNNTPHGDEPPFGGNLTVQPVGGNPGGYLRAEDTVHAGGGLFIAGPAEFTGDLSAYTELRFDEYLFPDSGSVAHGIQPYLVGSEGTNYFQDRVDGPLEVWRTVSVPLDAGSWTLDPFSPVSSSFEDVLADCRVAFNMDVATSTNPHYESGIDNIRLIPEPTTLALFVLGAAGAVRRRGR
jgi:hypothetical protein